MPTVPHQEGKQDLDLKLLEILRFFSEGKKKKEAKSSRVKKLVVIGWVTITAEHRLSSRLSECVSDILLMLQNLVKGKSF